MEGDPIEQIISNLTLNTITQAEIIQVWSKLEPSSDKTALILALLKHHYTLCDPLRLVFCQYSSDRNSFEIMKVLTQNGRDLRSIEEYAGNLAVTFLQTADEGKKDEIVTYLIELVKFSSVYLSPEHLEKLVREVLKGSKKFALSFTDAISRYCVLSESITKKVVNFLCSAIFDDQALVVDILSRLDAAPVLYSFILKSDGDIHSAFKLLMQMDTTGLDLPNLMIHCSRIKELAGVVLHFLSIITDLQCLVTCYINYLWIWAESSDKVNPSAVQSITKEALHNNLLCRIVPSFNLVSPSNQSALVYALAKAEGNLSFECISILIPMAQKCFWTTHYVDFLHLLITNFYLKMPEFVKSRRRILQEFLNVRLIFDGVEFIDRLVIGAIQEEREPMILELVHDWLACSITTLSQPLRQLVISSLIKTLCDSSSGMDLAKKFAVESIIILFHCLVQNGRLIEGIEIYKGLCVVVNSYPLCATSIRTIAYRFVSSFSCDIYSLISYEHNGIRYTIARMSFDQSIATVKLPIDTFLNSTIALLRTEPSHSLFQIMLEETKKSLQNVKFWSQSEVKGLCDTICQMILKEESFQHIVDLSSTVKKHDLFLSLYQILFVLYHHPLPKAQQDSMVSSLVFGLGRWPPIARHCLQGLHLALFELPGSLIRLLPAILMKISQVTSSILALPNLEFLASLASQPALHSNFTNEDYKRIFGIALTYLRQKGGPSAQQNTFAYYVMQVWFLSIKIGERSKFIPMIISTLNSSKEVDETGELVVDMMIHHTFEESAPKILFRKAVKRAGQGRSWSQGNIVITILEVDGDTEIVFRRPVGTTIFGFVPIPLLELNSVDESPKKGTLHLNKAMRTRAASAGSIHQEEPLEIGRNRSLSISLGTRKTHSPVIDLADLLTQFQPLLGQPQESLLDIPNDDSSARALSILDRTPSLDLHKIGVIYVSAGQSTEAEILANTIGSPLYNIFILSLGTMVELANNPDVYTGGLDTSSDCVDGPYGLLYIPDQKLVQVIFHVTTLMPTLTTDPLGTSKKRHIGNDFVTIVWNEGGKVYDRETMPGQFNLVHIIIQPTSHSFKVSVHYRSDLPLTQPAPILVSGSCLGSFVRQMAIYCNMIAQVYTNGEASSNAKERLRQIKRIKSRLVE